MGASELYLYGDSSGGTQAVQTMLWMEHHRRQGMQFGFNITAAVLFSSWLDLTDSNPTYDSNRHCTGDCYGIGDASFTGCKLTSNLPLLVIRESILTDCLRVRYRPGDQPSARDVRLAAIRWQPPNQHAK